MGTENTFYERGDDRLQRLKTLADDVACRDGEWLVRFIRWLRSECHMRTAPIVISAQAVKTRRDANYHNFNRQLVSAALQRPDEPGEYLAYWIKTYGRAIPKPVKRGICDAIVGYDERFGLYSEKAYFKWDSDKRAVRMADVIELCHPKPKNRWQSELFKFMIDERHGRGLVIPSSLQTLQNRHILMSTNPEVRRAMLNPVTLASAGMTWESVAGWLQSPMDKQAWEAIIPSMGYMALIRNLRNFSKTNVDETVLDDVAARIANPDAVAKSKQLPMRFLSAYRANKDDLRWGWPLERALNHSLANVPALPGRTLILVDQSGSMFWGNVSERSDLTYADTAAVFGSALALRAEKATLVQFGSDSSVVPCKPSDSLLKVVERFRDMGGTNTAGAVQVNYQGHDRVVIITDEQTHGGRYGSDPLIHVPTTTPVYSWNLAGYELGHGLSGTGERYRFGGLSDTSFKMIPLIEQAGRAGWPF